MGVAVGVGYSDSGWGELFEALEDGDLHSQALFASSGGRKRPPSLSIDTQVKAYAAIGLARGTEAALEKLCAVMRPQVISTDEFEEAMRALARHVLSLAAGEEGAAPDLVFLLEAGVKSNLWVFLQVMTELQRSVAAPEWIRLRGRISVLTPQRLREAAAAEKGKKTRTKGGGGGGGARGRKADGPRVRVILTDDCVYSGQQMAELAAQVTGSRLAYDDLHVCPAFSTVEGLKRVLNSGSGTSSLLGEKKDARISTWVHRFVGHAPEDTAARLLEADIGICVQSAARPEYTTVLPLFHIMGVLEYKFRELAGNRLLHAPADMAFVGQHLSLRCSVAGSAVAFQHKVADSVSIPTEWFLLGPTLRTIYEKLCHQASCDTGHTDFVVSTRPMPRVLRHLDGARHKAGDDYLFWAWGHTLSSVVGSTLMVRSAVLADLPAIAKKEHVRLDRMPVYAPLLDPVAACGERYARAHEDAARGDAFVMKEVEDMALYQPLSVTGARCVHPPYKQKLRQRLDALREAGRATHLLSVLLPG